MMEDKKNAFNLELTQYIEKRKKQESTGFSFLSRKKQDSFSNTEQEKVSIIKKTYDNMIALFSKTRQEPIDIVELSSKEETQAKNEIFEEETEYEDNDIAKEKSSLFSRLFPFRAIANLFKPREEINEEYETEETREEDYDQGPVRVNKVLLYKPIIKDEIKSVFSMTSDIIKKLPQKEQMDLMNTKEYQIYLALMKRYKLK